MRYSKLILFSGDEMFSDTYKIKLIDEVMYEVYGKVSFKQVICCIIIYIKVLDANSAIQYRKSYYQEPQKRP